MEVTKKLVVQYERIRQNGYCNMIDYYCVMTAAHMDGYHELSFLSRGDYSYMWNNHDKHLKQFDLKQDDSIWEEDIT